MLEIFKFVFENAFHFWGTILILLIVSNGIAGIIRLTISNIKNKINKDNLWSCPDCVGLGYKKIGLTDAMNSIKVIECERCKGLGYIERIRKG